MNILVLCGGESAERVVSWASGDAVANWIAQAGHRVMKYDPEKIGAFNAADEPLAPPEIGLAAPLPSHRNGYNPTTVRGLLEAIDQIKPDVIFPILHGGRGEDGTLQALLEWINVPFTGSGSLSCGLAMDKRLTRELFAAHGIPITAGFAVRQDQLADAAFVTREIEAKMGFPVVVKPVHGGSTVGLTKVMDGAGLGDALKAVAQQQDDALIEDLFEGRELTVTVVDGAAYPVIEIRPKVGFYDYANKYTSGRTEYLCPAPLDEAIAVRLQEAAVSAFDTLQCEGFARVDFLLNSQNELICLEVNTLPGMTLHSLVPKAARANGEEPPVLMQRIIDCAVRKFKTA